MQDGMSPSLNTTSALAEEINDHSLLVHIGDISYARGYCSQWDNFFSQISPIAHAMPWMTCSGNHERDFPSSGDLYGSTDSGGECGIAHERRMQMPRPSEAEDWYGFNYGMVHYVMMNTELDFSAGSTQYNFLLNDLKAVNRSQTPWVIFSGHRPMYIDSTNDSPGAGDQPVAVQLRQYIEPLLQQYQVDLAFWGHHHSYQRTCPVYNQVCKDSSQNGAYLAPVHIVTGAAGAGNSQNLETVAPNWIRFVNDNTHGYTRAVVTQESIYLEYLSGGAGMTEVLDAFTLLRPSNR